MNKEVNGPKLVATATIIAEGKVLLVKYNSMPDHQQGWFIPNDLVSKSTHPEDAAKKILKDQINLTVEQPKLSHLDSFTGNDGSWHLPLHYEIKLKKVPNLVPSEDIKEHKWFDIKDLPNREEVAHRGWSIDIINDVIANN